MFLPIQIKHLASIITMLLLSISMAACGGGGSASGSGSNVNPAPEIIKSISGSAQKGAFRKGSSVTASQLDDLANNNGEVVNSTVSDDRGNYSIAPTWSGWTEISVTGRYFDENSINEDATSLALSATELTLNGLISGEDEGAVLNVNLFTHFIAARIRYLLTTNDPNITIEQARNQAQADLKQELELLSENPEKLNIFDGVGALKNDNAILLLFSGGFMSNNGNATSLLALTDDFANNGKIDDTGLSLFQSIANYAGLPGKLKKLSDNLKLTGVGNPPLSDDLVVLPEWVNQPPSVTLTPKSTTIQEGLSVTLDGSASLDPDGGILSYSWSGEGAGDCKDEEICVVKDLSVGTHQITLTAHDDGLNSEHETASISVVPVGNFNNIPNTIVEPGTLTVKQGLPIVFNAASSQDADGDILSFSWSGLGTDNCGNNAICSINGLAVGVYFISVTASDNKGGLNSATARLTVKNANIPPIANAGNDQTITADKIVELSALGTDSDGTITRYEWKKGALSLGTSANITVSNLGVGVHEYTLTVTDNDGAMASDSVRITVTGTANIPPVANAGNDQTVVEGGGVVLSGSGSDSDGTINGYQWFEDGVLLGQGANITIPGLSVGLHIITLIVSDNQGGTGSDVVRVTVTGTTNIPPVANAGNDQTLAEGGAVVLSGFASDADGTITSYQWFEGGTLLGQTANITIPGLSVGTHDITLVVTDNSGSTGSDTVRVTVTGTTTNILPVANAGSDKAVSEGESIVLSGSGSDADGTITSYQWFEGGTLLGQTANITIPGLSAGTHIITLIVTDNSGSTDSDTVTVTIFPIDVDIATTGCTVQSGLNFFVTLTLQGGITGSGTTLLQQYSGPNCTGEKIGGVISLPTTYSITNIQTNNSVTTADMTVITPIRTETRQVTIENGNVVIPDS